ncbi:MAG: hypothetical protein J2P27_00090 [Actinobacteria bacterium]|nr:hypothetical protein [Actinomycetota bacterium]
MGHSHLDGAHTHGSSGSSVLDGLAQLIAVIVLGVAAVDVVMWVLHILIVIATGIGFLVLGTGVGYAAVRYRRHKHRRYQSWPSVYPPPHPDAYLSPYPVMRPPALPPGGDLHLHLPPGMSAEEIAQMMRRHQPDVQPVDTAGSGDGW